MLSELPTIMMKEVHQGISSFTDIQQKISNNNNNTEFKDSQRKTKIAHEGNIAHFSAQTLKAKKA